MNRNNMKRMVLILCKALHWTALAAVLLIGVLWILYEILDYPLWEKLVRKFGISDGIGFCWIVAACGIVIFLLTDWLEGKLPAVDASPEKTPEGEKADESNISGSR